ncbi:MAG TPA: fasciclin domain-containing protein [Microlunatus sp.]
MTNLTLARIGGAVALVVAATAIGVAPASAQSKHHENVSLAAVLAQDGSGFDSNPFDYDILDNAITAVLKAKPHSPVAVLAKGKTRVTAFLPNDEAFRRLSFDLSGKFTASESAVFTDLATRLGIDTIEAVLLYHVVPGKTITYKQARKASGTTLHTALQGSTIKVKVYSKSFVQLRDADKNYFDPFLVQTDINKGNRQIGHGINEVLRPVDL